MKKLIVIVAVAIVAGISGCKKSDFADAYADPSKVSLSSVGKQYTGVVTSFRGYILPDYWNYFVVLRTSLLRYTQAVGWENTDNQYLPPAAGVNDRWNAYYNFLSQYRELENIYNAQTDADKTDRRIFMITAAILFYDQTQKVVDLHGDIPWTEAGKLSANGGDYGNSLPKYDKAIDIYTKMLDDLKAFATELNAITVPAGVQAAWKTQDLVAHGDVTAWKRYCNSLRLRMLTRVSDVASLQGRVNTEIAEIVGNAATYPIVTTNAQNIRINVFNNTSDISSRGFRTGLEDWNGNLAGKVMIDHMKTNVDPRLRAMYEPGANAAGVFNGVDPLANRTTQNTQIAAGTVAIYNRSTLSRNEYFPGVLITASEVKYMLAEYYLKQNSLASARTNYEEGIALSVEFYYWLRSLSNDNTAGALTPYTAGEVTIYTASPGVLWTGAATNADKLKLIALQKWIHFSVVQPIDSWAEIRRLNAPTLSFEVDNSNAQSQPPLRWFYAASEPTYNAVNYQEVASQDNLTTKIFWDLN
jgi:tetratricopeptide (TPR) repeat protein